MTRLTPTKGNPLRDTTETNHTREGPDPDQAQKKEDLEAAIEDEENIEEEVEIEAATKAVVTEETEVVSVEEIEVDSEEAAEVSEEEEVTMMRTKPLLNIPLMRKKLSKQQLLCLANNKLNLPTTTLVPIKLMSNLHPTSPTLLKAKLAILPQVMQTVMVLLPRLNEFTLIHLF